MKKMYILLILCFMIGALTPAAAQYGKQYDGPDDPAGDVQAERTGFMNGNRVLLFFRNTTELSNCCNLGVWVSRWPNDLSGSKMHDGIHILLGARVYVENDTIPVDDLNEIRSRDDLDTLYYCETSYREFMDMDPTGGVEWGLYPVFGYFNESNPHPAMSSRQDSWPPAGWPSSGDALKWPGVWNGRFGLGETRADLESYCVANDAQDQEYLGVDDTVKYYPRPGVKIGDKRSQVSIQRGQPWGGLGLRVEMRGFQWKNPEAEDCIFWEYNIANISDYDLPEMYFGYQIDNAVGGEEAEGDDIAWFDEQLEMCYSWDIDGVMVGGGIPGCMGVAFLESPGVPDDGIDNDQDGITDEMRDNLAGALVGPMDGVDNVEWFKRYYGKEVEPGVYEFEFKEHWDADEDQDWNDGNDVNGNGSYSRYDEDAGLWVLEPGEDPGDDVGADGSGPYDLDYPGPDADGTECNHRPDLNADINNAEPNFAYNDIGESDMLGLTAFKYNTNWGRGLYEADGDENIWHWLNGNGSSFDEFMGEPRNFLEQFASGVFSLYKGRTERISMAELHAMEMLHAQNAPPFSAPALFKLKEVVQAIYESDYQFATPPIMPTLLATPGDGKVVLSWNDVAEKFTREPLLDNVNDFEGYKLYKSTDPFLTDGLKVTDGYGKPVYQDPFFECDKVDGIKGFCEFAHNNGALWYLGSDSGLQNYVIDTDVENGRTYYYALVAYDYGIDKEDVKVNPAYNPAIIDMNEDESINYVSRNVAVVTPHPTAGGYKAPNIEDLDYHEAFGKNTVAPEILVKSFLKDRHEYKVKFGSDTLAEARFLEHGLVYRNASISVFDMTLKDSLVYFEDKEGFVGSNFAYVQQANDLGSQGYFFNTAAVLTSGQFEGLALHYTVPTLIAELDTVNSDWITGQGHLHLTQPENTLERLFPYDFDILFTDDPSAFVGDVKSRANIKDEFGETLYSDDLLMNYPLPFIVRTPSVTDEAGNALVAELVVNDVNQNGAFDWLEDRILVGFLNTSGGALRQRLWAGLAFIFDFQQETDEAHLPKAGDVYHVTFNRGFLSTDSVTFKVSIPQGLDEAGLNEEMNEIKVVPNPYVVTNTMESAVGNWQKNQSRRIMFTHLPAQCTIKIFTASGVFVDEIEVNNSTGARVADWDNNSDANGMAYWDLISKEGLAIASGYYIYHVKSHVTGKEKMGKFAVIK